jgi:hypothetical protein
MMQHIIPEKHVFFAAKKPVSLSSKNKISVFVVSKEYVSFILKVISAKTDSIF